MQAKILILSYLCLYVAVVIGEDEERSWRTEWSHIYKEEDTIPHPWEQSGQSEGDILRSEETVPEVSARNINKGMLWTNGVVPYVIKDGKYSQEERQMILDAMAELTQIIRNYKAVEQYRNLCQLLFLPKEDDDNNFLVITPSERFGCSSHIGMQRGMQETYLSSYCMTKSTILHELLHVLGFAHQHSAHDAHRYIRIIGDNIQNGHKLNFIQYPSQLYTNYGNEYDFFSIMHYSPFAFAKLNEKGEPVGPTIVALDNRNIVKTNDELSDGDRRKLKYMYCP